MESKIQQILYTRGKNWCVEAKHTNPFDLDNNKLEVIEPQNREFRQNLFTLYLHVFDGNKLFDLKLEDKYMAYDFGFDWHGGCTYTSFNYGKEGKVISICAGCDYQHYGDESNRQYNKIEENSSVINHYRNLIEFAKQNEN